MSLEGEDVYAVCRCEETPCPVRTDRLHCDCWYDGGECCGCGDPAQDRDCPVCIAGVGEPCGERLYNEALNG